MPPAVMTVTGAFAPLPVQQSGGGSGLAKGGGRGGQGQHGAGQRDHGGEDASEVIHGALLGGGG
jgi:hypothetical protein